MSGENALLRHTLKDRLRWLNCELKKVLLAIFKLFLRGCFKKESFI